MGGQDLDLRRVEWHIRKESAHDFLALVVEEALADDADAAKPDAGFIRTLSEQPSHDHSQLVRYGLEVLAGDRIQRRRRLNHLKRHQPSSGQVGSFHEQPEQEGPHEAFEPAGRSQAIGFRRRDRVPRLGLRLQAAQDGEVQRGLVAEVVIHRRDVGSGATANFPHGGVAEAGLGEDGGGGVQELVAGGDGARIAGSCFERALHVSNTYFKQVFDTRRKMLFHLGREHECES